MNYTYIGNVEICTLRKELKEFEIARSLTAHERKSLREWVADGNSVYDNPFHMSDDLGNTMDYIEAGRTVADMTENLEYYCLQY